MSEHVFTVKSPHDERVDYYLDGELLISANHDDDGWGGMERIDALITTIAQKFGAKVEQVACDDEEDED